jgi:hypothetical protein
MDYETKIYLNNLIEVVEKLDNPDWWTIGVTSAITIVNAAIMIWLGYNQYKLLKRQTEAMEFGTYRDLYDIVKDANFQIDNFLDNLWKAEWRPTYQFDANFLKDRYDELSVLCKKMNDNITYYELKFSKDFIDINGYRSILHLMLRVYRDMSRLASENKIVYIEGMQRIYYNQNNEYEAYIDAVSRQFVNAGIGQYIKSYLESFVQERDNVRNNNVLEKIRERCKIE